ncbi:MAG: hypothetical protein BWY73_01525 [candidate division TA06 bacterium ADurb.Bin417]|uniref:PDZ domain-containing protein n=1 Tax=candidate division TA06 bacterium ADurb.Bin417 TaxID=1852828 RepID=A0A1V5M841_UNCT6|nr:MAG: hypothetical protein BWY73_01525 [candidate division TA06 bacterium ADurb.Bin417]
MIENRQARTEQVYPEGESIAEVRILKIVKNKVILIDAENKETVLTLVAEAAGALTSSSGTAGLEKSPAKPAPPTVITINPAEAGGPAFNSAYTVSLSEITQNVSASEELKQVRIAPVVNGGKVAGYQVNNLPANSIAFRYGLRNGDVVSRVNGIQLENMSRLAFIYSTIRPGSPVSVEILRKGQPVTLNFNVTP